MGRSQKLVTFWNPEVMGVTPVPENLSYLENHFLTNDNNYSKGHEPKPYEALVVIVGLYLKFTIVKM